MAMSCTRPNAWANSSVGTVVAPTSHSVPRTGEHSEVEPQEDGIVLASAAGTDVPLVLSAAALAALLYTLGRAGPAQPSASSRPLIVRTAPPEEEDAALAKSGEATLSGDRRRYILDGDGKGGGGHGPGRGTPKRASSHPAGLTAR